MVVIKFPDVETQDEAVGFLACSFSGSLLRSGEVIVPEAALEALASENFSFTVIGKATYEQVLAALRGDVPGGVQRQKARPKKVVREALRELVEQFGGGHFQPQPWEGEWRRERVLYQDKVVKFIVDVPDPRTNRRWMKAFKARWKKQLEQLELWMVSYRIDVE